MEKVLIEIGNKQYKCKIAKSEEEKRKGLMEIDYLPVDEGMLFVWDDEGTREMWMKNTKIPLDQIAINDDDEVTFVYTAQPDDETLISFPDAKYILEVNANSGIVEGDEFEINDDDDLNKYVMKVLAPDGSTQFFLQGGERIVSRKETKTLIKKAKKAEENKGKNFERYCKSLGKYMFKILKGQDTREPEYVNVPESKNKDNE
jgi:uncharacterized membrane protein (UPF0127 family)